MIIFSDEAGINLDADLGKIWAPKGEQPEILTHSPFSRVNLTSFVCPCRCELIINQMERGNAVNFIEQLKFLQEIYKDFMVKLYVDNARWHKTKEVLDWAQKSQNIQLDFLPKYAPKVNPMERHRWYLRKLKTKNKVFDSKEDCLNSIKEHLYEMSKEDIFKICQI